MNAALGVLVLGLLAAAAVLWVQGPAVTPGQSQAEELSARYQEITKAAREETEAFLTVDYTNMDPLMEKVLAGATGNFKTQYERAQVNIKSQAQASQAKSSSDIRAIGIGEVTPDSAVVFVAVDSEVTNKLIKGGPQPRYYRMQLTMVNQGDKWLTSDLTYVG